METQWPLVIFTFFVCVTCGLLGSMSVLALKGQGRDLQMTSLITAAVSLVIGGIGSFLHLQHWERIFNGFGHITSGITQELIGCVVLAILIVVWFVMLRGGKKLPVGLSAVTLVAAVAMVCATAHSYLMAAIPAWSWALVVFYLGNALMMGPVVLWGIAAIKRDQEVEKTAIGMSLIGAATSLVADLVYTAVCATATFANYGHYADPTSMTTAPTHIDSLMDIMVAGDGAVNFWVSLVCVAVVIACAAVARKKVGASVPFMAVAVVAAAVASILFRVLIYQLGYSVFLLY